MQTTWLRDVAHLALQLLDLGQHTANEALRDSSVAGRTPNKAERSGQGTNEVGFGCARNLHASNLVTQRVDVNA